MKAITIIMKITNACNLKCKHCYEGGTGLNTTEVMSSEVLENVIRKAQSNYEKVTYIWFGGEPLIVGLDFFIRAVRYQEKYNNECVIHNRIQTNGTLLSKDFICFFKQYDFNVSISYDGISNEVLRQESEIVKGNIEECKRYGLPANILATVCAETCDKLIENYEFFKSLQLAVKFNPIFPAGTAKQNPRYLLDETQYENKNKEFFKYWLNDENAIPVSTFVQYAKLYLGYPDRNCVYGACLYTIVDVEPNGNIFPCSRFSSNEYIIGNILDIDNFEDAFSSENYNRLTALSIARREKCKRECELYKYCLGGCPSACANEADLSDNNTQLCRITKAMLPFVFCELDRTFKGDNIINPILEQLYFNHNRIVK